MKKLLYLSIVMLSSICINAGIVRDTVGAAEETAAVAVGTAADIAAGAAAPVYYGPGYYEPRYYGYGWHHYHHHHYYH